MTRPDGPRVPVQVPTVVRNKARAHGALDWLESLPELVGGLCADWGLTLVRTFEEGTESWVAEVRQADSTPAVLKLLVPRDGEHEVNEAKVLRLADGQGCARLLRDDPARHALLLERLGPSMFRLGLPYAERIPYLCAAARALWRPAADCGLPSGASKGRWLQDFIGTQWEVLGRPCSAAAVEHALACCERRIAAHDDVRAVLVHGDVHQWNALQAGAGFKLIDPDGLLAEPEYDLGVILREDPEELLIADPFDRARWLASLTGTDAQAIWEWGVAERVSTGLLCTQIDLQPVGRELLQAAEAVAGL